MNVNPIESLPSPDLASSSAETNPFDPATDGGGHIADPKPELKNKTARAAATWAANTLYTITTMCVAFFTTPLLLRYLGEERMGAYRAAGEWMGYLSLIDLGITPALSVLTLRARVSGSQSETAGVFRSGLKLLLIVATVTALLASSLALVMPRLVPVTAPLRRELVISTLVSSIVILFLPFQMSRMLVESEQRGYWINFAHLFQAVTAAILSVVLARAGFGLIAQSTALLIGTTIGVGIYLIPTWRWYLTPASPSRQFVTPRSMWRLSWPLALSSLGVRLNLMTDSLVIGFVLGPAAVFTLFVTQRAICLFGAQVNSTVSASWAALAHMRLNGRHEAFVEGTLELTGLVVGVGTVLTGTVAAFNHHFVRLWVGTNHYGGELLSYLTGAVMVSVGLTTIYGYTLDYAGKTAARIPVSIAGAVLNLLLSIGLTYWLGLPGVVLGTLLANLASDAWFCPYQVSRHFNIPAGRIARSIFGGLAKGLPWIAATSSAAHFVPPRNVLDLAIEVCIVGPISLLYCWVIVLTPSERQRWAARFESKFRTRRLKTRSA